MHRILIVDEDEHLLWALEKNLFPERDDLRVLTAADGEAGLEILKGGGIDLVVSDIKMPGKVDGFQLILRAKEVAPEARVLIMTTFAAGRIDSFADRMGITHYIEKPFNISELRSMILELFDEKEGFQGMLSDLELTDIIQMLCLAKRSTLLHLKHRDHRGKIVFERGELAHAEFDQLQGPEAVYRMLALRQGDIFMESDASYAVRTIRMGWQDLLLEAVRLADEARLAEATRARQEDPEDNLPFASFRASDSAEIPLTHPASDVFEDAPAPQEGDAASGIQPQAEDFDVADEDYPPASHTDRLSGDSFFSEAELAEISMASSAAIDESGGYDQVVSGMPVFSGEEDEAGDARREHPWRKPGAGRPAGSYTPHFMAAVELPDDDHPASFVGAEALAGAAISQEFHALPEAQAFDAPAFEAQVDASRAVAASAGEELQADGGQRAAMPTQTRVMGAIDLAMARGPAAAAPADSVAAPTTVLAELEQFVVECARLRATGIIGANVHPETNFVETCQVGQRDPQELSARLLEIVDSAQRVVHSLDTSDGLDVIQLCFEDSYLVVRRLGSGEHFHFALVERDASLGVALVLMRQVAPRLDRALAHTPV